MSPILQHPFQLGETNNLWRTGSILTPPGIAEPMGNRAVLMCNQSIEPWSNYNVVYKNIEKGSPYGPQFHTN